MDLIDYQKKNAIVIITINRPDRLNAFGKEIMTGLKNACQKFEADDEARVAILTANGRAFSAGADMKDQLESKVPRDNSMPRLAKPIIAAVNGFALGIGCLWVLDCDIKVAASSASFGMPEINLGLYASAERFIAQGILPCAAVEMCLTGERISAQRAYEIGLVNKVVPDEELLPAAMKIAEKIAGLSPLAVRMTKLGAVEAVALSEEALDRLDKRAFETGNTEDASEAVKAFMEKRKPVFKGK